MILLNGAASVIESIYLGVKLTTDKFLADIIVNPNSHHYENKIIWVNSTSCDLSIIAELSKNNVIKSRVKLNHASFNYRYIPYRSDRIKRLRLKLLGESNYNASREDISKLIIFNDTEGDLATILPKNISLRKVRYRAGISSYELYLTLINNYLNNGKL